MTVAAALCSSLLLGIKFAGQRMCSIHLLCAFSFFHLPTEFPVLFAVFVLFDMHMVEGGWVHPKGADSMAVSGLHFENTLVGYYALMG